MHTCVHRPKSAPFEAETAPAAHAFDAVTAPATTVRATATTPITPLFNSSWFGD
jgi:hypothetical protein